MDTSVIGLVFILSVNLSGMVRCQKPKCNRFEYDRKLLSKVLSIEARSETLEVAIKRMENETNSKYADLERKFAKVSGEFLQQCRDLIESATMNVVKKPHVTVRKLQRQSHWLCRLNPLGRFRPCVALSLGSRFFDKNSFRTVHVEKDGWRLVFRATSGNGDSVYDAWSKGTSVTSTKPTSMKRSNKKHYSDLNFMNEWDSQNVTKVKVAFYYSEQEVANVLLNATDSSRFKWFRQKRLISSSWPSLTRNTTLKYFSMGLSRNRRFNIMKNHGGCEKDAGYFLVNDVYSGSMCAWQKVQTLYPQFMFSTIDGPTVWDKNMYGIADYFAIFVRM